MEITLIKDKKKQIHKMPTNWNEVSLGQYVQVIKKVKQVGLRELEKVVSVINILTGISEEDLMRLSTRNVSKIGGYISELIQSLPKDDLQHIIKIGDIEYGFHPKLADITMGEWVDIDTYIGNGIEDNMHKIMSVLYRPIIAKDGEKYAIEEYIPDEERQKLFYNELNVGHFYGVSVFFSNLGNDLLKNSLKYSIHQLKQENEKDLQDMDLNNK